MALNKYKQLSRIFRHLMWLTDQPKFYGTLEIQFMDSVPVYARRIHGSKPEELSELADPVRVNTFIRECVDMSLPLPEIEPEVRPRVEIGRGYTRGNSK